MKQQTDIMTLDENTLSIDFDDDNENYGGFSEFLKKDTERKKNKEATEIMNFGNDLLSEINQKKIQHNKERSKYIKYIKRHCKSYSIEQLISFDIADVRQIYGELKIENKSKFKNFFSFLFE